MAAAIRKMSQCGSREHRRLVEYALTHALMRAQSKKSRRLEPSATSSQQEIENHEQNDEIDTAPAVIAPTGAHVVAAAPETKAQ